MGAENLSQNNEITIEKKKKKSGNMMNDLALELQGIKGLNVYFVDDDFTSAPVADWTSTGDVILDMITGGGIPTGKFVEIIGKKSSGKSTVAMEICVNLLNKKNGYALIFDKESAWDYPNRCLQLGLDRDKIMNAIRVEPDSIETVFETIQKYLNYMILKKGIRDVPIHIYWDSIAATTCDKEVENGFEKSGYKEHAALINQDHRIIIAWLQKNQVKNVSFVWINQAREAQNRDKFSHNNERVTFGGDAPAFYSSIRIELEHLKQLGAKIKEKNYVSGIAVKVKTIKNKLFHALQTCTMRIMFRDGIDEISNILDWMIATKQLKETTIKERKAWKEAGEPIFDYKLTLTDGTIKYFNAGSQFRIFAKNEGIAIEETLRKSYYDALEKAANMISGLDDSIESELIETNLEESDESTSLDGTASERLGADFA